MTAIDGHTVRARSRAAPTVAVPRWTSAALAAAVVVLWHVTMEASTVSNTIGGSASFLHELFHDGRHLLGVPCH